MLGDLPKFTHLGGVKPRLEPSFFLIQLLWRRTVWTWRCEEVWAHLDHVLGTQAQGSHCRKVAPFGAVAIGDLDIELNWGENAQWVGGDEMVIDVGRAEGHLSLHT